MNDFSYYLDHLNEFGIVEEINYPISVISGLPTAKPREIVLFETGQIGEVYSIDNRSTDVLLFSQEPVDVGTRLVRTNKSLTVMLGDALLGRTVDPLGRGLFSEKILRSDLHEERSIDIRPLGIDARARIKRSLATGSTLVDMMVPLGKGQKELVIGDRKTGKSAFLFTTMKNQINEGSIAIYAAIGKKKSDIKHLKELIKAEGIDSKAVIVASSSDDSPSLIYLTPFTAMTIAEYFRDQGHDVLLILDDLSTHSRYYREIALLAKSFPGRDSYPGDIFYTHARLLERAGNFVHEQKGEVSITCLPVIETVEGDLTSYIATTLMGITDGHIFFDSNIFYQGRRPAINTALSVTRVGKQTQARMKRDITRELTSFFALYEKVLNLSHFGTELTDSVKSILATGDKLFQFFDQHYSLIVPEQVQIILFCLLWIKLIDPQNQENLDEIRIAMIKASHKKEVQQLFDEILQANTFNDLLRNVSLHKEQIFELWKKNTE